MQLTLKQWRAFNILLQYIEKHGFAPTIREFQAECGLASNSQADYYYRVFKRKGYVDYGEGKARARTLRIIKKGE